MDKLFTLKQTNEGLRREAILQSVARIVAERKCSFAEAATEVGLQCGVSSVSIWRWSDTYEKNGRDFNSLIPKFNNCGRKPLAVMTEEEIQAGRKLLVMTESKTSALRMLANSDLCSDATRAAILKPRKSKHTITRSIRAAISVSPAVAEFYKSPKQTQLNYFFNPRDGSYIDADGKRQELQAGDLGESDDMTVNFGWVVPWPGGDKCSDKYGVRLLRGQLLPWLDVRSCRLCSYALIARLQDSYRMDDIWQFFGQHFRDVGLPRIGARLERGIWEGSKINGIPLEASAHTSLERRLGGLAALNVRTIRSYSPLTKIIENRFNFLQTWMSTIPGQLGRTRGEMERQTKLWTACRDGRADPRDYFLSMEDVAHRIEAVMHAVNSEPVEGEIYRGVPDQVWAAGIAQAPLRPLPEDQAWLFARDRRVVTVCKGMARVRLTGPAGPFSYWFTNEDLYKYDGQKVAVYFDSFAEGGTAVITDAEGENPNRVLCVAREAGRVPQFAMIDGYDDGGGLARRKALSNAVRSEYRALGIAGVRLARTSEAQNGRGTLERIEVRTDRQSAAASERNASTLSTLPQTLNEFPGRDSGLSGNSRVAAPLSSERPGAAVVLNNRVADADAFEAKLREQGVIP